MFDHNFFPEINFMPFVYLIVLILLVTSIIQVIWTVRQNQLMKRSTKRGVTLKVLLEKDSDVDIRAIEQMWNTFHHYIPWKKRFFKAQTHFSFEISSQNVLKQGESEKEITFNFWVPDSIEDLVIERVKASYPFAEIERIDKDYIPNLNDPDISVAATELTLREHSAFSIRQFDDLEVDPLSSILSSMSTVNENEKAIIQVMLRSASHKWNAKASGILSSYERNKKKPSKLPHWLNYFNKFFNLFFVFLDEIVLGLTGAKRETIQVDSPHQSSLDSENQRQMLNKVQFPGYETQIRILVGSPLGEQAANNRLNRITSTFQELQGPFNGFKRADTNADDVHKRMKYRYFDVTKNRDVLTSVELSGFLHLVNKNTNTPGLSYIKNKNQEFPNGASGENPFAIAYDSAGNKRPVGLNLNSRLRHVYVSGMTGVGKSVLLENMIIQDINSGKGCVVIDPHGDLIEVVLQKINPNRPDVYVLDPSDTENPFGLNLLELTKEDPSEREMEKVLVIDAYITMMKRVFGDAAIGPNSEDIFRMSAAAILDNPSGGGLLEMLLILVNETYRESITPHIKDPVVENYWTQVFPALTNNAQFQAANLNAPLNKIRRFLSDGIISNIICQKKSTIDVEEVINSGGVILANFSRGKIGFQNSELLGTMLISKIQIAAMQRVNIPEDERVPTILYVDEFQNFVSDSGGARSFAEILSEARKYKLGLVLAHQFLDQLRQSGGDFLLSAIFNNCGTTITFRVGPPDAKYYGEIYYDPDRPNEGYKNTDIANLDKYTIAIRLMTKDGTQSKPFTAFTLPPVKADPRANAEYVIERSRSQINVKKDVIRESIRQRAALDTISSAD